MDLLKDTFMSSLKQEGVEIVTSKGKIYKALFRKNENGSTESYVTMYLPYEHHLKQGDTFSVDTEKFIVLKELTVENKTYRKHQCVKLNSYFKIIYGKKNIILYDAFMSGYEQKIESTKYGNVLDSDMKFILPINEYTKKIRVGLRFYCGYYGKAWKVTDINYKDNLLYLYCNTDAVDGSADDLTNGVADRWAYEDPTSTDIDGEQGGGSGNEGGYTPTPSDPTPEEPTVDKYVVKITEDTANMRIGTVNSRQLTIRVYKGSYLIDLPILNWTISDPSVCEIVDNTCVKALKEGTATITASYKVNDNDICVSDSVLVTVYPSLEVEEPDPTPNDKDNYVVEFTQKEYRITEGETIDLKECIKVYYNGTEVNHQAIVVFTSDDEKRCVIDSEGNVNGVEFGRYTISAKYPSSENYNVVNATCVLNVITNDRYVLKQDNNYMISLPSSSSGRYVACDVRQFFTLYKNNKKVDLYDENIAERLTLNPTNSSASFIRIEGTRLVYDPTLIDNKDNNSYYYYELDFANICRKNFQTMRRSFVPDRTYRTDIINNPCTIVYDEDKYITKEEMINAVGIKVYEIDFNGQNDKEKEYKIDDIYIKDLDLSEEDGIYGNWKYFAYDERFGFRTYDIGRAHFSFAYDYCNSHSKSMYFDIVRPYMNNPYLCISNPDSHTIDEETGAIIVNKNATVVVYVSVRTEDGSAVPARRWLPTEYTYNSEEMEYETDFDIWSNTDEKRNGNSRNKTSKVYLCNHMQEDSETKNSLVTVKVKDNFSQQELEFKALFV